ncbi:RsmB/NOP family class I SAM-dependent RNA methyltransferase [Arachnia propionica]|uniref:RsmB/NOP family class I SAM-dependent RNA methyltransferase n=1 Tax=Arachnia propionica TaxID=1750 RepID=UPI0021ADC6CD|nr:RsmB/NOP family class I SAM-dependent RNA methyltransferase [Arachnia propionica]
MTARRVAFDVLREVTGDGAYANLALAKRLATAGLDARDASFVTELVAGTCRLLGTYDRVIEAASGRRIKTFQPAVLDLLRLLSHQALSMSVPSRAAVATTVDLARSTVGPRVTGLVNAVGRRICDRTLEEWTTLIASDEDAMGSLAIRHHHPRWIAEAYGDLLPDQELPEALEANNLAPRPTLVVRPGLATVEELAPAEATRWSPFGATLDGVPAGIPAVREGRAGVQDEGSQLVALALTRVTAPKGPWLDLCAGPGGKAALLAGLAAAEGTSLVANEVAPHRAALVEQAVAGLPDGSITVTCTDGRRPEGLAPLGPFARIMVDAPCSGLGALRRRPESRWRRRPEDLDELLPLQSELLDAAVSLCAEGGVVAYVTCSPHRAETREIVEAATERHPVEVLDAPALLPEVPEIAEGRFVQFWPHRHGTDGMFLALLRRR